MNQATLTITEALRRELQRQATREGVPVEVVAARLLTEGLHHTRLESLEREVEKLRQDFAVGLQAMLVMGGNVTPEEAKGWVLKKIVNR
jgi:hypothetical protein